MTHFAAQKTAERFLRVFLSHSSGDKLFVRNLYTSLRSEGIDAWLDEEKILPGQEWEREIARAVRESDVVLICLSRSAVTKEGFVQKEIKYSLDVAAEKPEGAIFLIPVRIQECEVPDRLRRWQWVNYFESNGHEKLKAALEARASSLGLNVNSRFQSSIRDGDKTRNTKNYMDEVAKELSVHHRRRWEERPPKILICGSRGVGKTTTINTLFGKAVGEVGYYKTGTYKDEVYEWLSETETIHVVDLPGLGDSKKHDKAFEAIYRRNIKKADAVIVVVTAGEGALTSTVRTVELLIRCRVKPRLITFGFNKLRHLSYPDGDMVREVELDPVNGITRAADLRAIEEAKRVFLADLTMKVREDISRIRFSIDQVIEFDSKSGWNVAALLRRLLEQLPFETLIKFLKTIEEPAELHPEIAAVKEAAKKKFWDGVREVAHDLWEKIKDAVGF